MKRMKWISGLLAVALIAVMFSMSAFAASTGTVKLTSGNLNVRKSASTDSAIIGKLANGATVTIVDTLSGWYKIQYNGGYGYVSASYITVASQTGTVTATALNMRSGPNTSSSVIAWLKNGDKVTILESLSGWYRVSFGGKTGYVSAKYINVSGQTNNAALTALEVAKSTIGVKYLYGGTTLNGFDCSGMVQYAYKAAGITLPRTSAQQATVGVYVSRSELKPGDLVFFDTNGGNNDINHVGIYSGNGNFISALSGAGVVKEQSMNYAYWSNAYMTARRVAQ